MAKEKKMSNQSPAWVCDVYRVTALSVFGVLVYEKTFSTLDDAIAWIRTEGAERAPISAHSVQRVRKFEQYEEVENTWA